MTDAITLNGLDNHKRPRQQFADKIALMTDADFVKETESYIWLSAFASNNPRSDYHWMADACSAEAARRNKPELYKTAWARAASSA